MLHLITCHGRIMPRLAELLFVSITLQIVLMFFFVLKFYCPVNPLGSCHAWSVYLTTLITGQAYSPPSG